MPSIINNVNILNTIYLLPSKINHLRIVGKSYSIKKNKRHRTIFSKVLTKEYIISDLRPHAILGVLSDIFFISLSSSSRLIHNHVVSQWGLPVDFLLIWDWRNSDIKAGSPVLYIYINQLSIGKQERPVHSQPMPSVKSFPCSKTNSKPNISGKGKERDDWHCCLHRLPACLTVGFVPWEPKVTPATYLQTLPAICYF